MNLRNLLFVFFAYANTLVAQLPEIAQQWADSAEYLIHEDFLLAEAAVLNQKAKAIFEQADRGEGVLHCSINEIILENQRDKFTAALDKAKKLERKINLLPKEHHLIGLFYQAIAWSYWGKAAYPEALDYGIKAAAILKKYQDWSRAADALIICSYSIYFDKNADFEIIDFYIDETYQLASEHLPHSRQIFRYIYQLYGSILYQQGRLDKAIALTQEGLQYEYKLMQQQHLKRDSSTIAKYYNNLGRMYATKGDIEQAITYYTNSYLLYQKLKNAPELVKVLDRIGELFMQIGENEEANRHYGKILNHIKNLPTNPIVQQRLNSYTHLAVSNYFLHFGLHDSLINYYNRELPQIEKFDLATDQAYQNIGVAFKRDGDYEKATYYLKKALLEVQKKYGTKGTKVATLYFDIGSLYLTKGDSKTATVFMDSVISVLNASPISEGDKLFLMETLLDKSIAAKAFEHRGEAYMHEGQMHRAYDDFNNVIVLANYLRDNYSSTESKMLSINRLRPVYENAAITAWNLYENTNDESYKTAVFDFAEHSKSTLLNENLLKYRNSVKSNNLGVPSELLYEEEKLIVKIGKCKEKIFESKQLQDNKKAAVFEEKLLRLEQKLDSFELELQSNYPAYRAWDHGRDSVVSPEVIQKYLSDNSVFVEYFISDFHCFIVYITHNEIKIKSVPNFNSIHLQQRVKLLRRALSNLEFVLLNPKDAYQDFIREADWIYKYLLADEILEGKNKLIVVPDDYLNYIPFEVLLTGLPKDTTEANYVELDYLIKKYAIHYEYSAAVMANTSHELNVKNGKILGFAASYGKGVKYSELTDAQKNERTRDETGLHLEAMPINGTQAEMSALEHRYFGDYFYKEEANEQRFKEMINTQSYSVIHLAMHGVVDYKHPGYSSLMFTENFEEKEDNLLYAYEIQHINGNNANLVVLSACQTGYGRYEQGEGIISLGRSFMYAGIPSVIMTLWELNDHTSVEVMGTFYDNLISGMTKDEAMQAAKLEYLNNNDGLLAHPFFWASFVCIGNQQPIPIAKSYHCYYWVLGGVGILSILLLFFIRRRRKQQAA